MNKKLKKQFEYFLKLVSKVDELFVLEEVITYNESNLCLLLNNLAFISTSNKKFKNEN